MGFEYVDYDVLKEKILQSIQHLAKKYQYNAQKLIDDYQQDKAEAEELAQRYVNIPPKRRTQIGFLLTMIRCLDASTLCTDDKKQLINSLACYVYQIIFNEYDPERSLKNYFSSYVTSPDNSKFYSLLATSLDLRTDNLPSNAELWFMCSKLKTFMLSYIYVDPSDLRKGLLSANNPFNESKIDGFEVKAFLERLTKRIAKLEECVHSQSERLAPDELEKVKVKQQPAYSSSLGLFAVADTNVVEESALTTHCREAVGNSGHSTMPIKVK